MLRGVGLGLVIAFEIFTALMGWQARAEVAGIEERRAAMAQAVEGLKLSLQTRVLALQREAGLAMDLQAADRFVAEVTRPKADLGDALDRLVHWQACASQAKACRTLRDTLAGSRHELWLMQKSYFAARADLEKVDAKRARARQYLLW